MKKQEFNLILNLITMIILCIIGYSLLNINIYLSAFILISVIVMGIFTIMRYKNEKTSGN